MLRTASICLVVSGCIDSRSGQWAADADTPDTSPTCPNTSLALVGEGVAPATDVGYLNTNILLDGLSLYAVVTPHLRIVDLVTGASHDVAATETDTFHQLISAQDGVALFAGAGPGGRRELRYHDVREGTTQLLERYQDSRGENPLGCNWRSSHLVERGSAAWAECGYEQGRQRTRVKLWSGGETRVLYDDSMSLNRLALHRGNVVWSVDGDSPGVWLSRGGQDAIRISPDVARELAFNDESVFWTEQGVMWRHDLVDGSQRVISEEPCAGLVADGKRAAAMCGPDVLGGGWLVGAHPAVFEGDRRTNLATSEGLAIAGLELSGNRLAWVEYPPEAGCDDTGSLWAVSLLAPDAPRVLAPLRAGCWQSDMPWPSPQLGLSEHGVAWNYPATEGAFSGGFGWALFDTCE